MRHILALSYIIALIALGFIPAMFAAGADRALLLLPFIGAAAVIAVISYMVGVRYWSRILGRNEPPRHLDDQ